MISRIVVFAVFFCHVGTLAAADRLPKLIGSRPQTGKGNSAWTLERMVEVREVTDTAVCDNRDVAFIVKQSFVDENVTRYGLYLIRHSVEHVARKLVESAYLVDLACEPSGNEWSVRADVGAGVQLYEIDAGGHVVGLVLNPEMVSVGAYEDVVSSAAPRPTGVFAYQWSPNGRRFWYSRPVRPTLREMNATSDSGVTYDDTTMYSMAFKGIPALEAQELHIVEVSSRVDRRVGIVPSATDYDGYLFRSTTVSWSSDSEHILYLKPTIQGGRNSSIAFALEDVDVRSGVSRAYKQPGAPLENLQFPAPGKNSYFVIRGVGPDKRLVVMMPDGTVTSEYGAVDFAMIWRSFSSRSGNHFILEARLPGHDGLYFDPDHPGKSWMLGNDDLSNCSFSSDLAFGVCVRQNLSKAPELVAIYPEHQVVATLVRPNSDYDSIAPLETKREKWTNRYGESSAGYVIYPRNYVQGQKYPTIIVTHGYDARNKFLGEDLQWEYPIQFLAEQGYVILAVNEAPESSTTSKAWDAWVTGKTTEDIAKMQFAVGFNAVATMEAALQWGLDSGLTDSKQTGIVGYSRGSGVVNFVMTQSKAFKVASSGEGAFYNAGAYWLVGDAVSRGIYRTIFGGAPYDKSVEDNYRRFSPSYRAREFSGPLLEQVAGASGPFALELYELLQEYGIPTELVYYPGESHIFYGPRHRLSAMFMNVCWFDYWLLDRRSSDPAMKSRYQRWDAMASVWKQRSPQ